MARCRGGVCASRASRTLAADDDLYDVGRFGNARILHLTDSHAQLEPVFFREPSVNIGVGAMRGRPPHLVGRALLDHFDIAPGSRAAHAFTFLDYQEAAHRYGRMGGFAALKTPGRASARRCRRRTMRSCLTAATCGKAADWRNATQGADMVEAANLLGIDAMTGALGIHLRRKDAARKTSSRFKGEFLAQNVFLTEEAAFNERRHSTPRPAACSSRRPSRTIGGCRIGIIGQALPYVPIAHPKRFTPDWTFGIREAEMQKVVDELRADDKVDAVRAACRTTAWTSI